MASAAAAAPAAAGPVTDSTVDAAGYTAQELTDVLPSGGFTKAFSAKFGETEVGMGNVVTPTVSYAAPDVEYEAKDDEFYTIVMTDPDAPSRAEPTFREFLVRANVWCVVCSV